MLKILEQKNKSLKICVGVCVGVCAHLCVNVAKAGSSYAAAFNYSRQVGAATEQ